MRSVLSGRLSNRFHLDSSLSHSNDRHVTMTLQILQHRSKGPSMLSTVPGPATPGRARAMEASEMLFINLSSDFQPGRIGSARASRASRLSLRTAMRANAQAVLEISSSPNSDLGCPFSAEHLLRYLLGSCSLDLLGC